MWAINIKQKSYLRSIETNFVIDRLFDTNDLFVVVF